MFELKIKFFFHFYTICVIPFTSSAYEVQFDSFGLSHLREQDLKRMRNRVNEWRNEINASMARPPSW